METCGLIYGERGDRGGGETAQGGHRLDVGLDAGAAPGIGTGDDENAALHDLFLAVVEKNSII